MTNAIDAYYANLMRRTDIAPMELLSMVGRIKRQWQRNFCSIASTIENVTARYRQAFERVNQLQPAVASQQLQLATNAVEQVQPHV